MPRPVALTAVLLAAAGLSAQPPAYKLSPPKVVKEGGKTVAVFEYGKTDPAVRGGDLTFRLLPLVVVTDAAEVGFEVENRSDAEVVTRDQLPMWEQAVEGADSTGRRLTSGGVSHTGPGSPPDWRLPRHQARRTLVTLKPAVDPKATSVTVTAPAPPGGLAYLWRVTYPKDTWRKARDRFEPKLPDTRRG